VFAGGDRPALAPRQLPFGFDVLEASTEIRESRPRTASAGLRANKQTKQTRSLCAAMGTMHVRAGSEKVVDGRCRKPLDMNFRVKSINIDDFLLLLRDGCTRCRLHP
jgi:hypothetical protein